MKDDFAGFEFPSDKEITKETLSIIRSDTAKQLKNNPHWREAIREKNKAAVPDVIAISPDGVKHKFSSLSELTEFIGSASLYNSIPSDGMPYLGVRRNIRNWIFYRDIKNSNRQSAIEKLQKEVKEKTSTKELIAPWRSSKWRKSEEGKKYFAKKQKAKNKNKKLTKEKEEQKAVILDRVEYKSLVEASACLGVSHRTLQDRIKHNPDFCYYKHIGPKSVLLWYYVTPYGNFCDTKKLQEATNMSMYLIKKQILNNTPGWDYKQFVRTDASEKNSLMWKAGIEKNNK